MLLHAFLMLPGIVSRRYPVQLILEGESYTLLLTGRALTALGDLLQAAVTCPENGRTTIPSIHGRGNVAASIYRLREEIDRATDVDGIGLVVVENCYHGEYRLAVDISALHVLPAFEHLAPNHLSEDVVTAILDFVREADASPEAKASPLAVS